MCAQWLCHRKDALPIGFALLLGARPDDGDRRHQVSRQTWRHLPGGSRRSRDLGCRDRLRHVIPIQRRFDLMSITGPADGDPMKVGVAGRRADREGCGDRFPSSTHRTITFRSPAACRGQFAVHPARRTCQAGVRLFRDRHRAKADGQPASVDRAGRDIELQRRSDRGRVWNDAQYRRLARAFGLDCVRMVSGSPRTLPGWRTVPCWQLRVKLSSPWRTLLIGKGCSEQRISRTDTAPDPPLPQCRHAARPATVARPT